jgi:hypothetical protein
MITEQQLSRESLTLTVTEEIHVRASLEATFASLLEEMGPHNVSLNGESLAMVLEPWPGGRWYRDLGNQNGHFWGTVQAIRRPTLLEICGPLFMSGPVMSNVQYRLAPADGGTLISFRHSALGFVPDELRKNLGTGWAAVHQRVQHAAPKK